MSFPLFTVLSAAALAATGIGAASETRSAQSLPTQNLALAQSTSSHAGKFQPIPRLADEAAEPSDEGKCRREAGHWDDKHLRCRKAGWWMTTGSRLLIGIGTVTGIVLAVSDSGHHSGPGQSVSN